MMIRILSLTVLFLGLGLKVGCGGCQRKTSLDVAGMEENSSDEFALSLKKLSSLARVFSYSHVLSLAIIDEEKQVINVEHVQAVSDSLALHFKKKIDEQHFFELWHENNNFLVKNRLGPWRSNTENKAMYSALIDEGFNALSWIIEAFGLKPNLKRQSSDEKKIVYVIEAKAIAPDAPFLSNFDFKVVSSSVKGHLELDSVSKLPLVSRFTIEMENASRQKIKFEAQTMLTQSESMEPLSKPQAVEEGPLLYPVNIAPRFNDLMKHEQGDE